MHSRRTPKADSAVLEKDHGMKTWQICPNWRTAWTAFQLFPLKLQYFRTKGKERTGASFVRGPFFPSVLSTCAQPPVKRAILPNYLSCNGLGAK